MARGGHNKKSKAQAELTNTARKDRHVESVQLVPGVILKPPAMSTKATELWEYYIPQLRAAGTFEVADGLGLAMAFEAYALACAALDIIGDNPVIESDPYGDGNIVLKKHPGVTAWKEATEALRGLLSEYGLTPLARTRMSDVAAVSTSNAPQLPEGAPTAYTKKKGSV